MACGYFEQRSSVRREEMKYSSIVSGMILGLSGVVYAAQDDEGQYDADAASDDRVACIEVAIADEVEEGEQFDKFVEDCVQERIAQRQKSGQDKS
jgi:hypothetical protein